MSSDLSHAPGCFGAASVYDANNSVCRVCPFATQCASEAKATLQRLQERINVSDLLRKHSVTATTTIEAVAVLAMTARPTPMAQSPVKPVRTTPMEPVRLTPSSGDEELLAKLPIKPRALASRFIRAGRMQQIREAIAQRRNPFATAKPEFMRLACDALLSGGCSRSALKQCFQTELGWSDGTAGSHAGIAAALLTGFGIASEINGKLEMK